MTAAPRAANADPDQEFTNADLRVAGVPEYLANRLTVDTDPQRVSTSFTIEGVLVQENGAPIAGELIQVNLDAGPRIVYEAVTNGGAAHMLPLAASRTDGEGRFRLMVPALKDISSHLNDSDEAQLVFISMADRHSLLYHLQVTLPNHPGSPASAATVDESVYSAAAIERASERPDVGASSISVTDLTLTASTSGTASTDDADPFAECARILDGNPPQNFVWVQPRTDPRPFLVADHVLLQRMWTEGNTTATFNWDSTEETTITVGVEFKYKADLVTGGFSSSMFEKTSLGKSFTVENNEQKWAEAEWVFMWAELGCVFFGETLFPEVFELRPVQATGGDRFLAGLGVQCGGPQWTIDISVETRFGFATATTNTFNASVFGGGVGASLQLQQTQTESHELVFTPEVGGASICGQDNFPAQTSQVKEVVT